MSQPAATADIGLIEAFGLETWLVGGGALVLLLLLRLLLGWLAGRRRLTSFTRHVVLAVLSVVAVVAVALTLKDPVRDQVLKFLGIVVSAVLAFSSTTLVGNGLAGVMLRAQSHFRGGDWVSVGDVFGQVVHRGLLFTTVQNELRDLVTLPNSHLASRPVRVVADPTYISARVSLGYDVPHREVERLLLQAAASAGLENPYVYVLELGDFSILYRISGKLRRIEELLTKKSALKRSVLDALHGGGIEIVSPAFMNQRLLAQDRRFIPAGTVDLELPTEIGPAPEADTFDKGRQAKTMEQLEDAVRAAEERIEALRRELDDGGGSETYREECRRDLHKLEQGKERLLHEIEQLTSEPPGR